MKRSADLHVVGLQMILFYFYVHDYIAYSFMLKAQVIFITIKRRENI